MGIKDSDLDDFDKLFNEINQQTNALDGGSMIQVPGPGPVKSKAPRWTKPTSYSGSLLSTIERKLATEVQGDLIHSKDQLALPCNPVKIQIIDFLFQLAKVAPNFVTSEERAKNKGPCYIRLFAPDGSSYDPLTATALVLYKRHYNLSMSDYAGAELGLSPEDTSRVQNAADHCYLKDENQELWHLRMNIFAAIQKRITSIDWR